MRNAWLVFPGVIPGGDEAHYAVIADSPDERPAYKTSCGLFLVGNLREWDVGQDIGQVPLCLHCIEADNRAMGIANKIEAELRSLTLKRKHGKKPRSSR